MTTNLTTLSVSEACERTRLKPEAIYRLLESGAVAGNRNGRNWRVSEASLEAWVTRTVTPKQPTGRRPFEDAENPFL